MAILGLTELLTVILRIMGEGERYGDGMKKWENRKWYQDWDALIQVYEHLIFIAKG